MRTCEKCGDEYDVEFDAEWFFEHGDGKGNEWHFGGDSNDYWDCVYHASEHLNECRERMCPWCASDDH